MKTFTFSTSIPHKERGETPCKLPRSTAEAVVRNFALCQKAFTHMELCRILSTVGSFGCSPPLKHALPEKYEIGEQRAASCEAV